MISFNSDGSGLITAPTGAMLPFSAGITPADLIAMSQTFLAANQPPAPPPTPQPINLTVQAAPVTVNSPPVTVNSPDLTAVQTNVAQAYAYLPQLQQAISKIPGAGVMPTLPTIAAMPVVPPVETPS